MTFSPPNVDYVFLNEFNIEMLTFASKTENMAFNNDVKTEQIKEGLISDKARMEMYDLKYVSNTILFM